MPKAVLESASGKRVAFAGLQHTNDNQADGEDNNVDETGGHQDEDGDNLSTMSVDNTPDQDSYDVLAT